MVKTGSLDVGVLMVSVSLAMVRRRTRRRKKRTVYPGLSSAPAKKSGAWLVVVLGLNAALGSNYGYVNRKPTEATVLDLLGPWPLYVVLEMAIVITGWALITLPWTGLPRRRVDQDTTLVS